LCQGTSSGRSEGVNGEDQVGQFSLDVIMGTQAGSKATGGEGAMEGEEEGFQAAVDEGGG
jgi:hypothetical protein